MKRAGSALHPGGFGRTALLALAMRGAGAALSLVASVLIVRAAGAREAGLYFTAFSALTLIGTVARLGFDQSMVRIVAAKAAALGNLVAWNHVHRMIAIAIGVSLVLGALIILLRVPIATHILGAPELAGVLAIMMLALPIHNGFLVIAFAAQGFNWPIAQSFLYRTALNLVLCLLLGGLIVSGTRLNAEGGAIVFLFSALAALGMALLIFRQLHGNLTLTEVPNAPIMTGREIMAVSLPLLGTILASTAMNSVDVMLLSARASPDAVSYYVAAQRLATSQVIILSSISAIIAPMIATAYAVGDMDSARAALLRGVRICAGLSVVIFVALVALGPYILRLFGPEFPDAAMAPLIVIAIGQMVNMATGPVGTALFMTGGERPALWIGLASLLLFIFLSVFLDIGSPEVNQATAIAATQIVLNVLYVIALRRRWRSAS